MPNLETGKFEPLITGDDNGALTRDEEMQFRNMVNPHITLLLVKPFKSKFAGPSSAQDLQVCQGAECEGDGGR